MTSIKNVQKQISFYIQVVVQKALTVCFQNLHEMVCRYRKSFLNQHRLHGNQCVNQK